MKLKLLQIDVFYKGTGHRFTKTHKKRRDKASVLLLERNLDNTTGAG